LRSRAGSGSARSSTTASGYWNVRAGGQTIVVELGATAPFARLYLTVDGAREVANRINVESSS
jgi:hypothetical protein